METWLASGLRQNMKLEAVMAKVGTRQQTKHAGPAESESRVDPEWGLQVHMRVPCRFATI